MRAAFVLALAAVGTLLPEFASACAVCTGGGEESRTAFIVTTVGMSVLPLAMIGGFAWWIWRRMRQRDSLAAAGEPPPAPSRLRG